MHVGQHLIGLDLRVAQFTPYDPMRGKVAYKREMASKKSILNQMYQTMNQMKPFGQQKMGGGGQVNADELKEINLGTDKEPRPIYVSSLLTLEEESKYFELLMEYKDVFTWTYKEMSGLDPTIAVH